MKEYIWSKRTLTGKKTNLSDHQHVFIAERNYIM